MPCFLCWANYSPFRAPGRYSRLLSARWSPLLALFLPLFAKPGTICRASRASSAGTPQWRSQCPTKRRSSLARPSTGSQQPSFRSTTAKATSSLTPSSGSRHAGRSIQSELKKWDQEFAKPIAKNKLTSKTNKTRTNLRIPDTIDSLRKVSEPVLHPRKCLNNLLHFFLILPSVTLLKFIELTSVE